MPATTLLQAVEHCASQLEASTACYGHGTDNAWDEAVQLVLYAAGLPAHADDRVAARVLTAAQLEAVQRLLDRRIREHIPLPYLTGRAWFAELEFLVDRRAIIPRSPIAELITAQFRPWYVGSTRRPRILDLCCGGGCIGLACAVHMPGSRVDLVDVDADALALAQENAVRLGVREQVEIIRSDGFDALAGHRYQLIVSNPPYVDADDLDAMPAEYHHEPELALGSGADGLDLTRRILRQAAAHLESDGLLVVEVGNSGAALEAAYPDVPFTWVEFPGGGHGVFVMTALELQRYAPELGPQ